MEFDARYADLLYSLVEGQVWAVEASRGLYGLIRQIPDCQLLAQIDNLFGPALFAMIDAGATVGCQLAQRATTSNLLCARQRAAGALFAGPGPCRDLLGLLSLIGDRALLMQVNGALGVTLAALTGAGVAVGLRLGKTHG